MDTNTSVNRRWTFIVSIYCLLAIARACQVDNGQFLTTIAVEEEAEIGSMIEGPQFDRPETVARVEVTGSNRFFDYLPANNSFVVKERIDVDRGLSSVQIVELECTTTAGIHLVVEVEFELLDINDFSPEFKPSAQYTFSISEAAVTGTQVGVVEARDNDIKNKFIEYSILEPEYEEYFALTTIADGKAKISLTKTLDYESVKSYNITIIAKDCQDTRDCSAGQRTATAEVEVKVIDADDLNPEFDSPTYTASIFEDSIQGTVVVQLVALDQDELNDPVLYAIEGLGSEYFNVNTHTGMVTVVDTAGMVRGKRYLLQAKAWQANDVTKKTSTSLVIKVVATNGNAPQFTERSYDVILSEGSPINTTAVSFTVSDRDTTSQLAFEIVERSENFPFRLVVTGLNSADLKVAAPLDYETTTSYTLTIQVSDGEFMSQADVLITILNENDHNPHFQQTVPYKFDVVWAQGALVGVVKADDKDARDDPNPVSYKILPPHDSLFRINDKGEITLSAEAEKYESDKYLINVQAMDKGTSPRSTTTVVEITLTSTDAANSTDGKTKDHIAIYIVAGIAGVLLILVALLVMFFLKRRAKKTARQLRKDVEHSSYDKPFPMATTDTLNSSTDSQQTFQTRTTVLVGDEPRYVSEVVAVPSTNSDVHSPGVEEDAHEDDLKPCQPHCLSNNLSVISDSETEFKESMDEIDDSNKNIPPAPVMKCSSDSGRSSMREDRSPYMKRVPFKSFAHVKSASIDDNSSQSLDESPHRGTHSHSNSLVVDLKSNISNIRATEGPPIRTAAALSQNSINSTGYVADIPAGFRSVEPRRPDSTHSTTSDYESKTPTPEITTGIDYCADLPTHARAPKPNNGYVYDDDTYGSKHNTGSRYSKQQGGKDCLASTGMHRSDTPCSEVSTESDSTATEDSSTRPQMTIYF